jgi:hypothetical protein
MACRNHPGVAVTPESRPSLCTRCREAGARRGLRDPSAEKDGRRQTPRSERSSRAALARWITRADALLDELDAAPFGGAAPLDDRAWQPCPAA